MTRTLAIVVTLFLAPAAFAQPAAKDVDFTPLEVVVKREMADGNIPGAVVVVVQGDRIIYARGFGVTSAEGTDPVTPDHLFRVGSTTKMFVGMALAKLTADGKLKLDEPIGKLIDGLPPKLAAITPHQLLTHTAGLADDGQMVGPHDEDALGAGIKGWKDERLFTHPGDIMSYSNPGYWLAGYVAERAAGKPFADVLADELFKPLGMKRTTFRPLLAMTYPLAQGHELRAGKPSVVRPAADNAATWPAGSMFTSGNDLARFVIAYLADGKLDGKEAVPAAVLKTISTPHVRLPGTAGHYGYGLMIRSLRGVDVVEHGGARTGYGSQITIAPKEKVGVIVLANRSGAGMPRTVQKAAELLLPLGPEEKPDAPAKPSPEEMEKLAGVYKNGPTTMELKWADGKLVLVGAKELTVEPLGASRFRPAGGDPFTIVTGNDGKTTYAVRGARALKKQPDK